MDITSLTAIGALIVAVVGLGYSIKVHREKMKRQNEVNELKSQIVEKDKKFGLYTAKLKSKINEKDEQAQQLYVLLECTGYLESLTYEYNETKDTRMKTLAALGELAATIAHEVRNPLSGILGYASLLKHDLRVDSNEAVMVEKIITGVESINQTVGSILSFTRQDKLIKNKTSLLQLIRESIKKESGSWLGDSAASNVQFELQAKYDDLQVACDKELLCQVLFNILRNSREAMPEGGRISIRINRQVETDDCPIVLPAVSIKITDTGIGISRDFHDHVFNPFFTTKADGTGMGLAIAWKIIRAHGGVVSVESNLDRGTSFRIYLPL